jgi:hypothetical protein
MSQAQICVRIGVKEQAMTRRSFLMTSALAAAVAAPAVSARAPLADALLARPWLHVAATDAASGADMSQRLPHLASRVEYRRDGTYVFGDGADQGRWSLSSDGRRLTLASATFEYGVELTVERLDATGLRLASRMVGADGAAGEVVFCAGAGIAPRTTIWRHFQRFLHQH